MVAGARMSEVEALKDRIRELEWLLGLRRQWPKPRLKGIRVIGWQMIGLLLRWPLVTHDVAFRAIYGGRPEADQPKNVHIITTVIHRLRIALRPYDIIIEGQYGSGYYLDAKNKQRLAELVGNPQNPGGPNDSVARRSGDSLPALGRPARAGSGSDTMGADAPMGVASNRVAPTKHHRAYSNAA